MGSSVEMNIETKERTFSEINIGHFGVWISGEEDNRMLGLSGKCVGEPRETGVAKAK